MVVTRKGKGRRAPCGRGSPNPSGRGGRSSSRGRHAGSAPSTAQRPLRKSRSGALRGGGSVGSAGLGGFGCSGSNGKACQARRKRAPSGSPDAPGLGRAPGNGPGGSGVAIRCPASIAPSTLERRRRSSRGSEAQGSIGRLISGNAGESQRTRRWIKALRPVATPRAAARLPPGRPGLRHRACLTVRRHGPR